ncbi:2,4-dihydroxyhept-2-enedioate aldolase [Pseudorhodobacter antarcticus]|jgi:4-hydroxy-2-oxoheptanedioate aldolase|uniref:Hydroxypyruvate/pyruvate aldolase n=1 Tax=Pseudorhodobacter antarcticus TaxID=1077947 RepID=A0A1H8EWD5_9RHOB|nr:aldolase/citrate lyase family protein [Pseudorhodobacter antarcticus]SEN23775.1 2,4-dihydroxyhept-2-enedioate aldolase [Pseudorhodobacter antarcticus]
MDLPKNTFKAALKARQQQIGLWVSIPSAATAEALATCGFDWLLVDCEHTPNDPANVQAMLQALAPYPAHAAVRPGWNDAVEIKRLMDAGAQTVLVPYVQTAEEARAAVAAVMYPPRGVRGVSGMSRATRFGAIPNYTARANDEICLLVQVETKAALGQIEAIAAVEGVDGVFIGPADLAASMGHPGNMGHPEVKAAILDAVRRIAATGKAAGFLASDPALLREVVAAGCTFTAVGMDIGVLVSGAKALVAEWKG